MRIRRDKLTDLNNAIIFNIVDCESTKLSGKIGKFVNKLYPEASKKYKDVANVELVRRLGSCYIIRLSRNLFLANLFGIFKRRVGIDEIALAQALGHGFMDWYERSDFKDKDLVLPVRAVDDLSMTTRSIFESLAPKTILMVGDYYD